MESKSNLFFYTFFQHIITFLRLILTPNIINGGFLNSYGMVVVLAGYGCLDRKEIKIKKRETILGIL